MPRDRRHFILNDLGKAQAFKAKGGGSNKPPSDVPDRAVHAQALLAALDLLPKLAAEALPGVYLEVQGRPGEVMITKSLDVSDLTLLNTKLGDPENNIAPSATIFASPKGVEKLRTKIEDFAEKNRQKKDGTEGRPYNADLVQSIGAIVEAGLRSLWRSPLDRFPRGTGQIPWEIWLEKDAASDFVTRAGEYGVTIGSDRLQFPEDVVVIATATRDALALAIRRCAGVRALAVPTRRTTSMQCRSKSSKNGLPICKVPRHSHRPTIRTSLQCLIEGSAGPTR